jgi:hypothetical protein
MFQYLLAFFEHVCPLSIASMAFSSCWFIHMSSLNAIGCLLVLVDFVLLLWQYGIVVVLLLCLVVSVDSHVLLGW